MTNKKPAKREPSRQMQGGDKPEILVRRWGPDEGKADLARKKARHGKVRTPRKEVVTVTRSALQEEIDLLKAENEAERAKRVVTDARAALQAEIDRLKVENEALRKRWEAPKPKRSKAEKSKAKQSDSRKPASARVRKKKKRKRSVVSKPRVISTPMGGQPGFRR